VAIVSSCVWTALSFAAAPSPDEALAALKEGNARFVAGQSTHPRTDSVRIVDTAQNGQHPFTTVLTCSDSRVPVERVFDQGIGDVFVIRVAGNVCDTDEIVQSVGKTTDLVSEIAAASQEQAQGIDQVNTAVAQMDKVTQQNAANAEESASDSEELSAQAESMNEIVGKLVALVGGAASKTDRSGGPKKSQHHLNVHFEHKDPKVEKTQSKPHKFGKSDEAFHKIATHAAESKHAPTAKAATKAIPLDKSEHDLETFNN